MGRFTNSKQKSQGKPFNGEGPSIKLKMKNCQKNFLKIQIYII